MKRLIIDAYRITYRITMATFFSFLFSLLYISALNLILIYGLSLLLQGWSGMTQFVLRLFRFPFLYLISIVMLWLNYNMVRRTDLSKERKQEIFYPPILIYSGASIILVLYIIYRDKIF